jgi:hypothetical protein
MCLNELREEHKNVLAPTDSRYRPDIRQLELGNLGLINLFLDLKKISKPKIRLAKQLTDAAGEEKNRLEEKQRESRRTRRDEYKPKWFYQTKHPITQDEIWMFNNKYWLRQFSDCPDLY